MEYPVRSPIYGDPAFGQPGFPLLSTNIINMCTSRNLMCDALLVSTVAHIASSTFVERPVPCVIVAARGPGPATCVPRTRQPRHVLMTPSFLILDNIYCRDSRTVHETLKVSVMLLSGLVLGTVLVSSRSCVSDVKCSLHQEDHSSDVYAHKTDDIDVWLPHPRRFSPGA